MIDSNKDEWMIMFPNDFILRFIYVRTNKLFACFTSEFFYNIEESWNKELWLTFLFIKNINMNHNNHII